MTFGVVDDGARHVSLRVTLCQLTDKCWELRCFSSFPIHDPLHQVVALFG